MVTIRVFVGGWRVVAHGDGVEISSLRKVSRISSGKLTMRSARVVMLVANGTAMLARSVNDSSLCHPRLPSHATAHT